MRHFDHNMSEIDVDDDDDSSSTEGEMMRIWDKMQSHSTTDTADRQARPEPLGGGGNAVDDDVVGVTVTTSKASSTTKTSRCPPATEMPSSPPWADNARASFGGVPGNRNVGGSFTPSSSSTSSSIGSSDESVDTSSHGSNASSTKRNRDETRLPAKQVVPQAGTTVSSTSTTVQAHNSNNLTEKHSRAVPSNFAKVVSQASPTGPRQQQKHNAAAKMTPAESAKTQQIHNVSVDRHTSQKGSRFFRNKNYQKKTNNVEKTLNRDDDSDVGQNQHSQPSLTVTTTADGPTTASHSETTPADQAEVALSDDDPPVQEYIDPSKSMHPAPEPEIDCSLCDPPPYQDRPLPFLRRFNKQTNPPGSRATIAVSEILPEPVSLFWKSKFERLNACQTAVSDVLCNSDETVLVSAPTGAGKTALFEMAMGRFMAMDLLVQQGGEEFSDRVLNSPLSKSRKMVYVAPSKALCEERYDDWSRRVKDLNLGVVVAMITGDGDPGSAFADLEASHLVLTTPEKWDSMTRRWNENFFLFASCKLFLIDEVHLIGDETRGWCLESIVTRMKTIHRAAAKVDANATDIANSSFPGSTQEAVQSPFRIVAVSATLPNIVEVADVVGANEAYSFDESYRPVPLRKIVLGMGKVYKNEWRFWNGLHQHVPEIIQRFSHGKQSLIFCHSKREAEGVADLLAQKPSTTSTAPRGSIQYYLDRGVCYHHAGLEKDNRTAIEQAFAAGRIRCLAATSTLAVGVNLPAHLVIVLGTKAYRGGPGYAEIEIASILQMVGRAGRPGLDSSGVAVVLTDNDSKQAVEHALQFGLKPAKSKLLSCLPEAMNSEVAQGVVTSYGSAKRWLQTTFYFSCKRKEHGAEAAVQELCNDAIGKLKQLGLIKEGEHGSIVPRQACHIMNQHMVSYEEMASIASWPNDADQRLILASISRLINFPVRRNEKVPLKEVHKTEIVRFKLPGQLSKFTVKDSSQKAFILLQCIIGKHEFDNNTLRQEMASITNSATKILHAAQDYSLHHSHNGKLALESLKLERAILLCMWGVGAQPLNAISGVGSHTTNRLRLNGIVSFQNVLDVSEDKLETAAGRRAPFGREIKAEVAALCRDSLKLHAYIERTRTSNTPASLICRLSYHDPNRVLATKNEEPKVSFSLLAHTDQPSDSLVLWIDTLRISPGNAAFRVILPPSLPFGKLFVHLMGTVVGFDQAIVLSGSPGGLEQDAPRSLKNPPTAPKMNKRVRQAEISFSKKRSKASCEMPQVVKPTERINTSVGTATTNVHVTADHSGPPKRLPQRSTQNDSKQSPFVEMMMKQRSNEFWKSPMRVPSPVQTDSQEKVHAFDAQAPESTPRAAWFQQTRLKSQQMHIKSTSKRRAFQQVPNQSQRRAFATRHDNPFTSFRHDPNETEGFLEILSHQSQSPRAPVSVSDNPNNRRLSSLNASKRPMGRRLLQEKFEESFHGAPRSTQQAHGYNGSVDYALFDRSFQHNLEPIDHQSHVQDAQRPTQHGYHNHQQMDFPGSFKARQFLSSNNNQVEEGPPRWMSVPVGASQPFFPFPSQHFYHSLQHENQYHQFPGREEANNESILFDEEMTATTGFLPYPYHMQQASVFPSSPRHSQDFKAGPSIGMDEEMDFRHVF